MKIKKFIYCNKALSIDIEGLKEELKQSFEDNDNEVVLEAYRSFEHSLGRAILEDIEGAKKYFSEDDKDIESKEADRFCGKIINLEDGFLESLSESEEFLDFIVYLLTGEWIKEK